MLGFIYLFTPKIMVCIFQVQSSQLIAKDYVIPGREIPKWFEKVNICDTSVFPYYSVYEKKKKSEDTIAWVLVRV